MAIRAVGFDYLGVIARVGATSVEIDEALLRLADSLRAAGYKVGLLSNLTGDWIPAVRAAGVPGHFDAALFSGETGIAKPDVASFKLLAEELGVPLNELAFIDDSAANLAGLGELGVTPVLFENYQQLVRDLSAAGVVVSPPSK